MCVYARAALWMCLCPPALSTASRLALQSERDKLATAEHTITSLKERICELQAAARDKRCSVCGTRKREEIMPKADSKVSAKPGQVPKNAGVGMRITEYAPHRVVELLANGPAARCKKISLQDCLVAVNELDVNAVCSRTCLVIRSSRVCVCVCVQVGCAFFVRWCVCFSDSCWCVSLMCV